MTAPVRVFNAEEIRRAITFQDVIGPVSQNLIDYSDGRGESNIFVFAPAGQRGDVHVKSAWLPGRRHFTVKVATSFAARLERENSPSSGYVAVHDSVTGDLIAILEDQHHLTDVRTAAAGAIVTRALAVSNASTVAVLGTGVQAYLQVLAAMSVRSIKQVRVWGRSADFAQRLAKRLREHDPRARVEIAASPEHAVRDTDIVITATASRVPLVRGNWLTSGQHVTAVGADDPTKAELDAECFRRADLLVVDSRAHASEVGGDLRLALDDASIEVVVHAEIGEVLSGRHPGRTSDDQVSVAKLVGLGVQDLAAAEVALELLNAKGA